MPKFKGKLLMFLDGIVIKCFCAIADFSGCLIDTVSQNITYAFTPDDPVKQPIESSFFIGRACFIMDSPGKVLVSENAGLIEFNGKGQYLRC